MDTLNRCTPEVRLAGLWEPIDGRTGGPALTTLGHVALLALVLDYRRRLNADEPADRDRPGVVIAT